MICFPNAKINLGLHILGKRADGYHNIETIFYPIPLRDALEIVPSTSDFSLTLSGLALPPDTPAREDNIVWKALMLFNARYPHLTPLDIYLRKVIPVGAGLGGGSSDAAFMLKLLDRYANLHLPEKELEEMAAKLGADCPFFVRNQPVMASGIGNVFEDIPLSLEGYTLCIVKPPFSVSTAEAYAGVTPTGHPPVALKEIVALPVNQWRDRLRNDFEPSVCQRYPEIREIKEQLYAQGAVYAAMSGSGSAVFGLFDDDRPVAFPSGCFTWKGILK
jgi:4-diphosphocytidyl-2-C-methyl-D-erythritol kinase